MVGSDLRDGGRRQRRRATQRSRWRLDRRALYATLWASTWFAVGYPVLMTLREQSEFFVVRNTDTQQIILLVTVLGLVPFMLVAVTAALAFRLGSAGAERVVLLAGIAFFVLVGSLIVFGRLTWPGELVVATSLAMAALATWLVATKQIARRYGVALAPAPLIIVGLFFSAPGVSIATGLSASAVELGGVAHPADLIVLVLDELPLGTLLDGSASASSPRIDGGRFPGFARLAESSTWYPHAKSPTAHTAVALPTLLTGRYPTPGRMPTADSVGPTLFSELGMSHDVVAVEPVTTLCPTALCERYRADSATRLLRDVGVLYEHMVTPEEWEGRLDPIDRSWADFGGSESIRPISVRSASSDDSTEPRSRDVAQESGSDDDFMETVLAQDGVSRQQVVAGWLAELGVQPNGSGPIEKRFDFLHVLLPHTDWNYLPSGNRYDGGREIPGLILTEWVEQPVFSDMALQRYLLQLQFVDTQVGAMIDTLRSTDRWEDAMVVVVADHGMSFTPGSPYREYDGTNDTDIASIPLFIKYPGQTQARVDKRLASLVDVVPTVLAVMGSDKAGTDLRGAQGGNPPVIDGRSLTQDWDRDAVPLYDVLGQQIGSIGAGMPTDMAGHIAETFGGSDRGLDSAQHSVAGFPYGLGPDRELLGASEGSLEALEGGDSEGGRPTCSVELDGSQTVDVSAGDNRALPVRVAGVIGECDIDVDALMGTSVLVAVDGDVAGAGRTFPTVDRSQQRFSVIVDEAMLTTGLHSFSIWLKNDGYTVRAEVADSIDPAELVAHNGRLTSMNGHVLTAAESGDQRLIAGQLTRDFAGTERTVIEGWAAKSDDPERRLWVVAVRGDEILGVTATGHERIDVAFDRGESWANSGFSLELPAEGYETNNARQAIEIWVTDGDISRQLLTNA